MLVLSPCGVRVPLWLASMLGLGVFFSSTGYSSTNAKRNTMATTCRVYTGDVIIALYMKPGNHLNFAPALLQDEESISQLETMFYLNSFTT